MANNIKMKRSAVAGKVPATTDLQLGEIAINTYDGKAYILKDNGTQSVVQIGGGGGDVSSSSSSSVDNSIARFDGTTGKLIQNSVVVVDDSGNVSGVSTITDINYVDFNTGYSTTLGAGQMGWDGNNTLALGMAGGNVIQHIGEDLYFYCKATSAITKGQVVMFTGAVGASGVPTGAPATGITDGTYIMGIAAESIALNGFGLVQAFGELRNVNTSGYSDGDILWYNPSVTGGLTSTKPSAPNVKVQMAAVINGGSSGGGTILIRINPGSTLGGTDSNAQINGASNGQIITYDTSNGYWKNTTLNAGTGVSVSAATGGALTVGLTSIASAMVYDQFTATASQTSFTTSQTYTSGKISVYKNGTKMRNGTDVTVTSGTAVVFAVACTVNDTIDIDYPVAASSTNFVYDIFTATASQTTFATTTTYTPNKIDVYRNGTKMRNGTDVTTTSGTSVVFATGLTAGDLVDLVYPT